MTFKQGHTPSHKGRMTTTEPLRDLETVKRIRQHLASNVRYTAFFSVSLNSALRASDLCRLKWVDADDDGQCFTLRVLERKTGKTKSIPLNASASADLRAWREQCESEYVYSGQRGPLTTSSWSRIVKEWFAAIGVTKHVASHSMRKSFVRLQHDHAGTSITTLMVMLNHSHPLQTMKYMGKMTDDVTAAYSHAL